MKSGTGFILCFRAAVPAILAVLAAAASPLQAGIRHSVVLIECASQAYRFDVPWKKHPPVQQIGTGFLVGDRTIITNAHVVSDAIYIEVMRPEDDRKYVAELAHIAHDCDLATLRVQDESFFAGMSPLELGDIPELDSTVSTYGFPLGGTQISVTRGVVSRIQQLTYSHTGSDAHLVVQTDAAINPGNSGGPVMQDNKVVGMAFQALMQADNIGYMIPTPVIRHFLDDIQDGRVDGFGEIGVAYRLDLQNPMVRRLLAVPRDEHGVVVTRVFPGMPAFGKLRPMDVLMKLGDNTILDNGMIMLDGREVDFPEVMERLQAGTELRFRVWREGRDLEITLPLKRWDMVIPHANPYGVVPRYYIYGGLCFTPLSSGYLGSQGGWGKASLAVRHLYAEAFSDPELCAYEQFPVLCLRLPAGVNAGADDFVGGVVESVDGVKVRSLRELKGSLENAKGEFVSLKFSGLRLPLVLSAAQCAKDNLGILGDYGVPAGERL